MSTPQDAVRYVLTRDVDAQRIHFSATFPERKDAWTLQLPTWRPGRYELGNFAQYVLWVEGVDEDGQRMRLAKQDLHAWAVPAGVQHVEWLFHADILNAGSTCIETDLYYVNPVNCFMFDLERQNLGANVVLSDLELNSDREEGWALAVAMPWHVEEGVPCMQARDVQHLMDSPWMASPKLWHDSFKEQGLDVHIWVHDTLPSDLDRFVADHVAFTRSQLSFFGSFPVDEYHFLYLFPDRDVRHGVEHEDSTVIAIGPAERVKSEEGYMEILGIASHELYHAWNVKRIRPAEWTPYDFTGPCPSELGYVAEGVTTYMGDLFLVRIRDCGFEGMVRVDDQTFGTPPQQPGPSQHERGRVQLRHVAGRVSPWRAGEERQHLCRRRGARVPLRHPNHGTHRRQVFVEHRHAVALGAIGTTPNRPHRRHVLGRAR